MNGRKWIFRCAILILPSWFLWIAQYPQGKTEQARQEVRHSAPTFYLVENAGCGGNEIEVHGASNLPAGAIIVLRLANFNDDGWTFYGNEVSAVLGENGYLSAKIPLTTDTALPHNLIIMATFDTVSHQQPPNVLKTVGNHGEKLDGLHNPQAYAVSGFNTTLRTIARAPCGPK